MEEHIPRGFNGLSMTQSPGTPAETPEGLCSSVEAKWSLHKRGSTNEPGPALVDVAGEHPSFCFGTTVTIKTDRSLFLSALPSSPGVFSSAGSVGSVYNFSPHRDRLRKGTLSFWTVL